MSDRIEKQIEMAAPVAKVWAALTDHTQFREWFCLDVQAPFKVGEKTSAMFTVPGYEHVRCVFTVERIEPQRLFSYSWHPFAVEPGVDYTDETPTLVEFTLSPSDTGTRLVVSESGFDRVPERRRLEAYRMNTKGWEIQLGNIQRYVQNPNQTIRQQACTA